MHTNTLQVGYARVNITPQESVPLAGYGNTSFRMSNNVLSELCSTCIAFTDADGSTVLLFHNDLIGSTRTVFPTLRQEIADAVGLPVSRILAAATHTHSAPDLLNEEKPSIPRYIKYLTEQMIVCAKEALADRKPATMATSRAYTKNLNFVRHYTLADGNYKGDNFGSLNPNPITGHTTQADPEMRLVKFTREGGKDVLLVNWQTHPHRTGGGNRYDISADIVGSMRDELEAQTGCLFIYFSGGGGNVNPHSRIPEENITADYLEQGKALADCAIGALDSFVPVEAGKVQLLEVLHQEQLNRPSEELLAAALKVKEFWSTTNDSKASVELAEQLGLHSQYHAGAIVRRHNDPNSIIHFPMYAFSIGDVAFVTAPYEMFDTSAKYIRDFSPFQTTVVASCANSSCSYVPSSYGFIHGCYEADVCNVKPGTGERLAAMYVNMLNDLYKTK